MSEYPTYVPGLLYNWILHQARPQTITIHWAALSLSFHFHLDKVKPLFHWFYFRSTLYLRQGQCHWVFWPWLVMSVHQARNSSQGCRCPSSPSCWRPYSKPWHHSLQLMFRCRWSMTVVFCLVPPRYSLSTFSFYSSSFQHLLWPRCERWRIFAAMDLSSTALATCTHSCLSPAIQIRWSCPKTSGSQCSTRPTKAPTALYTSQRI